MKIQKKDKTRTEKIEIAAKGRNEDRQRIHRIRKEVNMDKISTENMRNLKKQLKKIDGTFDPIKVFVFFKFLNNYRGGDQISVGTPCIIYCIQ